jgi:hypothetical protein
MIVQHDGWYGHTSFALTDPTGGILVYHYFARGHRAGATSSQNVQGLIYDNEWIWHESYSSFGAYLDTIAKEPSALFNDTLEYSVQVLAYAYGTKQDDQRLLDKIKDVEIDQSVYGRYSFVMGDICSAACWDWFHEHAGSDAPMPAYLKTSSILDLSAEGAKHLQLPHLMYVTKLAKMPSVESIQLNLLGIGDFGF